MLDKALEDPELIKFFNQDKLKEFRDIGGVCFFEIKNY